VRGFLLSVGLLAALVAVFHPERALRDFGEHLDPFRTPAAFAQQANAICTDYQRSAAYLEQRNAADMPVGTAKGMQAIRRVAALALALAEREVARFHALDLPATNRGLAKAWIAAHDKSVVLLGRLRNAAQRRDARAAMIAYLQLGENGERQNRLALKLGINACSSM
jgi:hypothetical protein